jgi:hypothetical protein
MKCFGMAGIAIAAVFVAVAPAKAELQGNSCSGLYASCLSYCKENYNDPAGGGPGCAPACVKFKSNCMATGVWQSRLTYKAGVERK